MRLDEMTPLEKLELMKWRDRKQTLHFLVGTAAVVVFVLPALAVWFGFALRAFRWAVEP